MEEKSGLQRRECAGMVHNLVVGQPAKVVTVEGKGYDTTEVVAILRQDPELVVFDTLNTQYTVHIAPSVDNTSNED